MPELRQRLPGLPAEDPSEEARFLLFDALARFLRAAAARRPVVLVLDDLHVADRPSLRLLEFVARGLRGSHLLIVGAYRDPDARLDPELTALLAGIEREGQRFPLRRLVPDEVDAFIAELTGAPADRALVGRRRARHRGDAALRGRGGAAGARRRSLAGARGRAARDPRRISAASPGRPVRCYASARSSGASSRARCWIRPRFAAAGRRARRSERAPA
jgi:hypothetical protein